MANDIIYLIKSHKSQIIRIGKKIFAWYKNKKASQGQPQGGGGGGGQYGQQQQQQQGGQYGGQYGQQQQGGYAGAAASGMPAGGYQQPQQQQHFSQQMQQQPGQPSFSTNNQGLWDHPPQPGMYHNNNVHPSQIPPGVKPHHGYYNDNEINQKNQRYQELRATAHSEGDKMSKAFDQAHAAHARGDGGRAAQLSNEGHEHQQRMQQANQEAADWIFHANNEDSGPNEVDLHGLYTQEAVQKTEEAVRAAQAKGLPELRVIVGKGIHSPGHVAKIKPAIEQMMQNYHLAASLDPKNAGVLIVHLGGAPSNGQAYTNAGFTRQVAQATGQREEDCTIM